MKNFKKKFLSAMLACLMLAPCSAGFAACDNGENSSDSGNAGNTQHEHTWSENFSYNDTKHYKVCSGCSEKSEEGEHTYGTDGYICTVCGYENEAKKPAQKQSAADVFGGVKASYVRGNITDADGSAKSFNEILDRQIDLLAQDILYRLTYVYGEQSYEVDNHSENAKLYLTYGGKNFTFNENNAVVDSNKLLAEKQETVDSLKIVNITDIRDFQKSMFVKQNNYLNSSSTLRLSGAIEGNYMKVVKGRSGVHNLSADSNEEKRWIWGKELTTSTYEALATKNNINAMKAAIAQTLAGETVNGNFATYQTTLAKINALGYENFDSEKLVNFIKSNVIGDSLVAKDDSYAEAIKTNYQNTIDDNSLQAMDNEIVFDSNNLCNDSPRLYKGYNIVVPAIVERAIENTFDGSDISLYPAMNRYAVKSSENLNAFAGTAQAYNSVVLMPKAENSATKLALKIKGANNIGVKCEINGEAVQVTASNDGDLLLIDLHAYAKKIGAYNGGKENDFSLDLFGNSGAGAASIDNGAHYIKLIFENPTGGKFTVEIDGYYNK